MKLYHLKFRELITNDHLSGLEFFWKHSWRQYDGVSQKDGWWTSFKKSFPTICRKHKKSNSSSQKFKPYHPEKILSSNINMIRGNRIQKFCFPWKQNYVLPAVSPRRLKFCHKNFKRWTVHTEKSWFSESSRLIWPLADLPPTPLDWQSGTYTKMFISRLIFRASGIPLDTWIDFEEGVFMPGGVGSVSGRSRQKSTRNPTFADFDQIHWQNRPT